MPVRILADCLDHAEVAYRRPAVMPPALIHPGNSVLQALMSYEIGYQNV